MLGVEMIISTTPTYNLSTIKSLVSQHKLKTTKRVDSWLEAHYHNVDDVIQCVIAGLEPSDFVKSFELKTLPGIMADVYVGSQFDDTEWYVKVFIEDNTTMVQIWSMNWDGSLH